MNSRQQQQQHNNKNEIPTSLRASASAALKRPDFVLSEFICKYDSHCNKKGKCNVATGKCECEFNWYTDDCTPPICK